MQEVLHADKDFTLWMLLHRTRDAMYESRKRELRKAGISTRQAAVLFVVQALGNRATPAEISRWLFRRPHTISGVISNMEKEGLVRKVKDLSRKNLVRIEMTKKGQQANNHATKRVVIHRLMSLLSEEERQQLSSYLEKLRSGALEELGIDSKPLWP